MLVRLTLSQMGKDLATAQLRSVCSCSLEPASLPKHESSGPAEEALSRDNIVKKVDDDLWWS